MSDPEPAPGAPAEPSPQTLGGYEVLKTLGADAHDGVFVAREQASGKVVTLKSLALADRADFAGVAVLISKARNAERLKHPRLIEVYDFLEVEAGQSYCVMEPVHGETLQMRATRKPLLISEAVTVVAEISEAVTALHLAGRVHGALDASLIFLAELGVANGVKLLDFGVVPGQEGLLPFTRLAPEQVERGLCDVRTDVWGLGALLFELLEGKSVHDARELSRETQVGEPVSFLLREVVETALLAAPESRFKSAAAFREALLVVTRPADAEPARVAAVEAAAPAPATDAAAPEPRPAMTAARPSRLKWALLAVPVLIAGLAGAVWALWPKLPPPPPPVVVAPPPEPPPPLPLEATALKALDGAIRLATISIPQKEKKSNRPVTKMQLTPKKHGR